MCHSCKTRIACIKDMVKRIPILGKILFWAYCCLKAPIIVKQIANLDLSLMSVNRPYCYLGNNIAITRIRNFRMLVNTKDIAVIPDLILDGFWEMHITPLFESIAKEGFIVVDIGANVGYYTLFAAQKVGRKGKVYAFEPEPRTFDILCKNIEINNFGSIVTACQKVLLNRQGQADLAVYEEHPARSSVFIKTLGKKKTISVQSTTLDAFLGNDLKIDLIKMDAEGSEPFIFEGMKNVIKNSPTLQIIMEFAPKHIEAAGKNPRFFLQSIKDIGFSMKLIDRTSAHLLEISIDSLLNCEVEDLFLEKVHVSPNR